MESKWVSIPLGEIAENISRPFDFDGKDQVIFINTGDVLEGHFLHRNYSEVHGLPGQAKKALEFKDILYSEIRPGNKRYAFIDFEPKDYVVSTKFMVVKAKERVLPEYLYLVLTDKQCENEFKMIAESRSGTFPQITFDAVSYYPVAVPSLAEQKRIVSFVGAIDRKLNLLKQINETLEAMARAIFKSWFVDFDPVRAKSEGRDTGLPSDIAALFPDSFVDSELGKIPKGWSIGVVDDFADLLSGKRPDIRYNEISVEASVPLWGGNGPMAFVPEALFNDPILLTGRVGTLGSVFRITMPCWPSDNTLVVKARTPHAYEYLFLQLKRIDFAALNRGSTQPLLTQTDLNAQPILQPAASVLESFHAFAMIFYAKIDEAERASSTLAIIRDSLLPKLMSGEIDLQAAGLGRKGPAK